jgi:hypothetical protein
VPLQCHHGKSSANRPIWISIESSPLLWPVCRTPRAFSTTFTRCGPVQLLILFPPSVQYRLPKRFLGNIPSSIAHRPHCACPQQPSASSYPFSLGTRHSSSPHKRMNTDGNTIDNQTLYYPTTSFIHSYHSDII